MLMLKYFKSAREAVADKTAIKTRSEMKASGKVRAPLVQSRDWMLSDVPVYRMPAGKTAFWNRYPADLSIRFHLVCCRTKAFFLSGRCQNVQRQVQSLH